MSATMMVYGILSKHPGSMTAFVSRALREESDAGTAQPFLRQYFAGRRFDPILVNPKSATRQTYVKLFATDSCTFAQDEGSKLTPRLAFPGRYRSAVLFLPGRAAISTAQYSATGECAR